MGHGIFYGIGVGPGDKELITLKAVNTIQKSDYLIIPKASQENKSVAGKIIDEYLKPKTEKEFIIFPMTKDNQVAEIYKKASDKICEKLLNGKNVGFITIGDPMFYSTFCYLKYFVESAGFETKSVAGIFSFAAIASGLGISLGLQDDKLAVVTGYKGTETDKIIEMFETVIFLKISKYYRSIKSVLVKKNILDKSFLVSNYGMENEKITNDLKNMEEDDITYLSTMILRKGNIDGKR